MRMARWALLLSTAMFVTSVWFAMRAGPSAEPPPPVATNRQLMLGLVIPASNVIYGAAGTISTLAGTIDKAPKDDKEWEVVAANAAILVEASQLLVVEGRGVHDPVWTKAAADLGTAARNVITATQAKNVDQLLDKGGELVASCDNCHEKFLPGAR